MKNKAITSRDVDFAKWYTDVVMASHLANYSNVKGCVTIEPNGYAIWEKMQEILDKKFKSTGHTNVYMPVLIPENLMKKEGELIEGFAPEVAWVTKGGEKELEERMCIRPTSETLFSDYYSNVDNDGNIGVFLKNISTVAQVINKGERIAQGAFFNFLVADNGNTDAVREGGFGSSGK